MDYSKMSDDELQKLASGGKQDFSSMSDEELERIANPPSQVESGLRGAAQGATLGFADELAGAGEALWDVATTDKELKDLGDLYTQRRDESRENFKRAKEANPGTYLAGEVGGGLATGLATGVPTGLRSAVTLGAGLGGAAGVGGSEGKDWAEVTKDGLKGAGIGVAGGAVAHGASKVIPWAAKTAGEKLKAIAEMRAVKALGGSKAQMQKMIERGDPGRLGRTLLDEDVVTMFGSKQGMADRLDDLAAGKIDDLTGELNRVSGAQAKVDPVQALELEAAKFSPQEAAEALKNELRQKYSQLPDEILEPQLQAIDKWLSKAGRMDIKDAQAFKTQMQQFIKDGSYAKANPGMAQETLLGIRNKIKTGIENNADAFATMSGGQGGKIQGINKDLGGIFQGQDMLDDAIVRGSKNRTISLTDYITGNAGAAAMGPKGMALALANKVGREKGSQISAVALDRVSKFLLRSPKMQTLAQSNPAAFRALASSVAQRTSTKVAGEPVDDEGARQSFLEGN
jgi:hypothetical protein